MHFRNLQIHTKLIHRGFYKHFHDNVVETKNHYCCIKILKNLMRSPEETFKAHKNVNKYQATLIEIFTIQNLGICETKEWLHS